MIDYAFTIYDLEFFLLIFTRVTCFIYIAPFFSMSGTPRNVRVAVGFFVSALLYGSLTPAEAAVFSSVYEYALIVAKEAVAGLLIGLSVNICTSIFAFAGQIADMEIGLTMVQVLDPNTRQNVSFTGAIYNYAFTMMLIAGGMYRYLLSALADSFRLIPVNGVVIHADRLLESTVTFLTGYVTIGFRVILPIFTTIMMTNAVLGIMARVAPQMHIFSVGHQLKILIGLGVLFLTFTLMPKAADLIFEQMRVMMSSFVEGLSG